jgi:hypothetical protein
MKRPRRVVAREGTVGRLGAGDGPESTMPPNQASNVSALGAPDCLEALEGLALVFEPEE